MDIQKVILYALTICVFVSCNINLKKETSNSGKEMELTKMKSLYYLDSLKYGADCADFLDKFSLVFYINNKEKVMSNVNLDTLIRSHEYCLRSMTINELSSHLDTSIYTIRYYKPGQASKPYDLFLEPFWYKDTMRYLSFNYHMDETYWGFGYFYEGYQQRID